jgi:antiviral helicase SKI2
MHQTKVVEASLTQLKLKLSDQNLELLPDYESRVEVLKQLKFIDDNSTVLLKGRVACEVSSLSKSPGTKLIHRSTRHMSLSSPSLSWTTSLRTIPPRKP